MHCSPTYVVPAWTGGTSTGTHGIIISPWAKVFANWAAHYAKLRSLLALMSIGPRPVATLPTNELAVNQGISLAFALLTWCVQREEAEAEARALRVVRRNSPEKKSRKSSRIKGTSFLCIAFFFLDLARWNPLRSPCSLSTSSEDFSLSPLPSEFCSFDRKYLRICLSGRFFQL